MPRRTRFILLGLRLGAVASMIVTVYLLSRLMLWLPWQADCVMAAAAAFAFAYKFERETSR